MAPPAHPILSVSNTELYNRWAKYYDIDGNILQAIDDHEIPELLKQFFDRMPPTGQVRITELGCGTGRNTTKLLQPPFTDRLQAVYGLDLSEEMLQIAQKRCDEALMSSRQSSSSSVKPTFQVYDALAHQSPPVGAEEADGVISTLVLEHLPTSTFFEAVKTFLKKGGYLLLTNMHEEMGKRGQAGFIDVETGQKIRGMSFAHSIEETTREAENQGFRLDGVVRERGIEHADVELVGERGRKWVGCNVWFGCIFKYTAE